MSDPNDTVMLVPLSELADLARVGLAMLEAQRVFFELRKSQPHVNHDTEFRAARRAEDKFRAVAREAMARARRQQAALPGFEEGGATGR